MLNSLFGKRRSTTTQPSSPTHPNPTPGGWAGQEAQSDQEEDGYLLVGETASERNTVLPSQVARSQAAAYADAPPTYQSMQFQQSSPPPNMQAVQSSGPWSSHIIKPPSLPQATDIPDSAGAQAGPSNGYAFLVMADVPFRLSEELNSIQKLSVDVNYYAVPRLNGFDPTKYAYDFEHERSVMRETSDIVQ